MNRLCINCGLLCYIPDCMSYFYPVCRLGKEPKWINTEMKFHELLEPNNYYLKCSICCYPCLFKAKAIDLLSDKFLCPATNTEEVDNVKSVMHMFRT